MCAGFFRVPQSIGNAKMVRHYVEINLNMGMEPQCVSHCCVSSVLWLKSHLYFVYNIGQFGVVFFHDFLTDAMRMKIRNLADLHDECDCGFKTSSSNQC